MPHSCAELFGQITMIFYLVCVESKKPQGTLEKHPERHLKDCKNIDMIKIFTYQKRVGYEIPRDKKGPFGVT